MLFVLEPRSSAHLASWYPNNVPLHRRYPHYLLLVSLFPLLRRYVSISDGLGCPKYMSLVWPIVCGILVSTLSYGVHLVISLPPFSCEHIPITVATFHPSLLSVGLLFAGFMRLSSASFLLNFPFLFVRLPVLRTSLKETFDFRSLDEF